MIEGPLLVVALSATTIISVPFHMYNLPITNVNLNLTIYSFMSFYVYLSITLNFSINHLNRLKSHLPSII